MTALGMTSHTTRMFDIEFLRPGSAEWKIWDGTWSGQMDDPEPEKFARKALKGYRKSDPDLEFRLIRTNSTISRITEIVG